MVPLGHWWLGIALHTACVSFHIKLKRSCGHAKLLANWLQSSQCTVLYHTFVTDNMCFALFLIHCNKSMALMTDFLLAFRVIQLILGIQLATFGQWYLLYLPKSLKQWLVESNLLPDFLAYNGKDFFRCWLILGLKIEMRVCLDHIAFSRWGYKRQQISCRREAHQLVPNVALPEIDDSHCSPHQAAKAHINRFPRRLQADGWEGELGVPSELGTSDNSGVAAASSDPQSELASESSSSLERRNKPLRDDATNIFQTNVGNASLALKSSSAW